MKVRPCHVPCLTVSCMNVAIDAHSHLSRQPRTVSIEELVAVSQSACTAGDVSRMSRVIYDKLALADGVRAVSALEWIHLLRALVVAATTNEFPTDLVSGELLNIYSFEPTLLSTSLHFFSCGNRSYKQTISANLKFRPI
ncbi:hypothetical protein ACJJTC_002738 [Scirpophaga incertulas]